MIAVHPTSNENVPNVSAIDLFCGAGGLTYGLQKAGIHVRMGIDMDPACEYPYIANNKARFLLKSVEEVSGDELKDLFVEGAYSLLAGCAPCQTFSTYNNKANKNDKRWWLLDQFSRLIKETEPDIVTMENVPGLMDHKVFNKFTKDLKRSGYRSSYQIVSCAEYGIPQNRRRLVLLASKHGPINLLTPEELKVKRKTVRKAIGTLPPLQAGEALIEDPLHQCAALSPLNMKRIRASQPGGTWRDWETEIVADCHKKANGKTYPSVYGRMSWNEPSPTITTQFYGFGNGRFGHPEQDRAISLREGAILQGFPKNYKFVPKGDVIHKSILGRMIGNAVPVQLAKIVGMSIMKHVEEIAK